MNIEPINSNSNPTNMNLLEDVYDYDYNPSLNGRIVKEINSNYSQNPVIQKVLELGEASLYSAHIDTTQFTSSILLLQKFNEGIHQISKPATHLELTKDDIKEIKGMIDKTYDSAEMTKKKKGYFAISEYARQTFKYYNINDYGKNQDYLNFIYKNVNSELEILNEIAKARPLLINEFELEMKDKTSKFKENILKKTDTSEELETQKEELLELFNSDRAFGTLEETKNLKSMQAEVERLFIPSSGTRIRNQQAGYLIGNKIENRPFLAWKLLLPALRRQQQIPQKESTLFQINTMIDVMKPILLNVKAHLAEFNSRMTALTDKRAELYHSGDKFALYFKFNLLKQMGVEPIKHYHLEDSTLKTTTDMIKNFANVRNVVLIGAPQHAMLISADPENKIYRFFDPNGGIFRFDNPETFAINVAKHISRFYTDDWALFDPENLKSPQDDPNISYEHMFKYHMEVPISQAAGRAKAGDLELDTGVCLALCAHVAKHLLMPQDPDDQLTTDSLGLQEFNEVTIREERAKIFLDQRKYKEAIVEFNQLLDLIPQDKRDPGIDKIKEELGHEAARTYANEKGYFKDQASLGYTQATILNEIHSASRAEHYQIKQKELLKPVTQSNKNDSKVEQEEELIQTLETKIETTKVLSFTPLDLRF